MLCSACKLMLQRIADGQRDGKHHNSWDDWHASIAHKCTICCFLNARSFIKSSSSEKAGSVFGFISYSTTYSIKNAREDTLPEVNFMHASPGGSFSQFSIRLIPLGPDFSLRDDLSKHKSSITTAHTGDDLAIEQLLTWMKTCLEHHRCREWTSNSLSRTPRTYSPPRLLAINQPGTRIHLVDTRHTPVAEPYASLSYRWVSNPQQPKLSTDQLPNFVAGFHKVSLPRIFQEAIEVTRRLGLKYLWIDSLCIIQSGKDHTKDWLDHVGQMGAIYENSLINISASHFGSSQQGLFFERTTPSILSPLNGIITTGSGSRLLPSRYYWMCDYQEWTKLTGNFPLDNRGWVFQERSLALRTVLFTKDQLFWECAYHPRGLCELLPVLRDMPTEHRLLNPGGAKSWRLNNADGPIEWLRVLQQYTKTELTKPEDKLPAIAGMARRFSSNGSRQYVAGHFRSHLPWSLLWKPQSDLFSRAQGAYRAPTWSWAAYDGAITHILLRFNAPDKDAGPIAKVLCSVVDCNCTFVNLKDMFGQVSFAEIELRGPLLIASWRPGETQGHQEYRLRIAPRPDDPLFQAVATDWYSVVKSDAGDVAEQGQHFEGLTLMPDCKVDEKKLSKAALLIILEDLSPVSREVSKLHRFLGLMLIPSRKQADKWERIGTFLLSAIDGQAYHGWLDSGAFAHVLSII